MTSRDNLGSQLQRICWMQPEGDLPVLSVLHYAHAAFLKLFTAFTHLSMGPTHKRLHLMSSRQRAAAFGTQCPPFGAVLSPSAGERCPLRLPASALPLPEAARSGWPAVHLRSAASLQIHESLSPRG